MKYNYSILFILLVLLGIDTRAQSSWKQTLKNKNGEVVVFYFDSQYYIHKNEKNKLEGIEYELLNEFFRFTEEKYKLKLNVKFIQAKTFGGLYDTIKNGASGMFGSCSFSITPERKKEVNFTKPYMPDVELLVSSNNFAVAKDTQDIARIIESSTVLTIKNTTFEKEIFDIKKKIPNMKIEYKNNYTEIKNLVFNDDNYIAYLELPVYFMSLKNGALFKRQPFFKVTREGYAIIYPKNSDWDEPLNAFFNDVNTDKKIEEILKKNLGEDINSFIDELMNENAGQAGNEINLLTKENEIKQIELEKKQIEAEKQSILKNVFLLSIIVLVVILLLIFNISRIRKNANNKLTIQNDEIKLQKTIIEEKNKNIIDSINYAKRIQDNILPSDSLFKSLLPDSFVIYKPKDIISGDFYFVGVPIGIERNNIVVFAVGDCTGHGVPGALLSIIGKTFLQLGLTDKSVQSCSQSLNYLNRGLLDIVKNKHSDIADGMDIAICAINFDTLSMEYAGANNPVYISRNGEIIILEANKFGIGQLDENDRQLPFDDKTFQLQKGDIIYLFSDGYADQFGGEKNKKFTYKRLREKLIAITSEPMDVQQSILLKEFDNWKGDVEQTDDVCVIGVRV